LYLLRNLVIARPNQVWCADVTYIPMARGFLHLVAMMDWASRAVLAWRHSNTLDADVCVRALEDALARFGRPEIFTTDQGSQFTSAAFTGRPSAAGIQISMDGRGRWIDNVFIERLWRSLKYEEVGLKGYADAREARAGIALLVFLLQRHPASPGAGGPAPDGRVAGGDDQSLARERRGHDAPASGGKLGRRPSGAHTPTAATTTGLQCGLNQRRRTAPVQRNRAPSWSSRWGPLHSPMRRSKGLWLVAGAHRDVGSEGAQAAGAIRRWEPP
jgi:hypothetical protein